MVNFEPSRLLNPRVILLFTWITCASGSSVNLTVEGGVSLVGPHCPGTVRMFCEGVDITLLRWRYNENMDTIAYYPDGTRTTQPTESAFFSVQLWMVEQDPNNPNMGTFFSSLTVNISQLQSNNIGEISCGAPGILQVEPVNVSIIEPGIPSTPMITMVTATYQDGGLSRIEAKWTESDNFCSSYGIAFFYELNITAFDSNCLSCSDESNCVVRFSNLTGRTDEFVVSVRADNEFGNSDRVVYPATIAHQVQQYFISEVFVNNQQLFGRCKTVGGPLNPTECCLQYTSDSLYRNLSTKLIAPLDTDISVPEIPVPEKTYYFQFSVLVTDTFQTTNRLAFKFSFQSDTGALSGWITALVILTALVVLLITVILVTVVLLIYWKPTYTAEVTAELTVEVTVEFLETTSERASVVNNRLIFYNKYNVLLKINGSTCDPIVKRYRDFENLAKRLKERDNRIVEDQNLTLPQSNLVDRCTNDFDSKDNQRETDELQQFMDKVVKIPDILTSPPVHEFLALGDKGINLDDTASEESTDIHMHVGNLHAANDILGHGQTLMELMYSKY